MHIRSLSISNILTFPYVPFDEMDKFTLFHHMKDGGVAILIGPNGSGKTNFLEIINQVLNRGLFVDFLYSKQDLLDPHIDNINVVKRVGSFYKYLKPHKNFVDQPSHVRLGLAFYQNDRDNMNFVIHYADQIESIIHKYSSFDIHFPRISIQDIQQLDEIMLDFDVDHINKIIKLRTDYHNDPTRQFVLLYLQYFELIQTCIDIYNNFEKTSDQRSWYELKNTFAIMSSYRSFGLLDDRIRIVDDRIDDYHEQLVYQNTKTSQKLLGFELVKKKLVSVYDKQCGKNIFFEVEEIKKSDLYQRLTYFCQKYCGYSLEITKTMIDHKTAEYMFFLVDKQGNHFTFNDISSGSKSLLMIFFSLYGFDLGYGLFLLDEPELHLHPQLQKQFIEELDRVSHELGLQSIIATHSPLMVNDRTIPFVYRFCERAGTTKIFSPHLRKIDDTSNLIQMLKINNSAKIFFVDTIIMVEGDTDEYFFGKYCEYLSTLPEWKDRIKNYEIININGKGSYTMRKKFLTKFGLNVFFIGDWDNIINDLNDIDFNSIKNQTRQRYNQKGISIIPKTKKYAVLINYINTHLPHLAQRILSRISTLGAHGVFFLPHGDIETYLGMDIKGLEAMVTFEKKYFADWLIDPKFNFARHDFQYIFQKIFPPLS